MEARDKCQLLGNANLKTSNGRFSDFPGTCELILRLDARGPSRKHCNLPGVYPYGECLEGEGDEPWTNLFCL
jgi:hypothetical protein